MNNLLYVAHVVN